MNTVYRKTSLFLIFTSIICLFTGFTQLQSPVDCSRYQEGTFYGNFYLMGKVVNYSIIRKGNIQLEEREDTGDIEKYKLTWTGDCSYNLQYREGSVKESKDIMAIKKKLIIKVQIMSGNKDYYVYKSTNNLEDVALQDTIWLNKSLRSHRITRDI